MYIGKVFKKNNNNRFDTVAFSQAGFFANDFALFPISKCKRKELVKCNLV